jgi:hypothetical protein
MPLKSGHPHVVPYNSVLSGPFGEEISLLTLLGIEQRFLCCPACSSLVIATALPARMHCGKTQNRPHRRVISQAGLEWGFGLLTALPHNVRTNATDTRGGGLKLYAIYR